MSGLSSSSNVSVALLSRTGLNDALGVYPAFRASSSSEAYHALRFLAASSSLSSATVCEFLFDDLLERGLLFCRVGGGGEDGRFGGCFGGSAGAGDVSIGAGARACLTTLGFGGSTAAGSGAFGPRPVGVRLPFTPTLSLSLTNPGCCTTGDCAGEPCC